MAVLYPHTISSWPDALQLSPSLLGSPSLPPVPLGALKGPLGGRCPWPLSLIPSMLPSKHSQLATANRKLMADFLTSGVLCSVPWFLQEAPRLGSCPVPVTPGSLGFPPADHPALARPSVFPQLPSSSRLPVASFLLPVLVVTSQVHS